MAGTESAPSGDGGAEISIGFLTALVSSELVACEEVLEGKGWLRDVPQPKRLDDTGIVRWTKKIGNFKVSAYSSAINDMGQADSALETICFLQRCRPKLIFLTGIAGSLYQSKVLKRDVVISAGVNYRTQNRVAGEDGCDEYRNKNHQLNGYDPDKSLKLEKMATHLFTTTGKSELGLDGVSIHSGDVFTWDYVVDSARTVAKLNKDYPKALCVEMEAGGFLKVVDRNARLKGNRAAPFVVRGISDYAGAKDKEVNVRADASRNAAIVALTLAEHIVETNSVRAFANKLGS